MKKIKQHSELRGVLFYMKWSSKAFLSRFEGKEQAKHISVGMAFQTEGTVREGPELECLQDSKGANKAAELWVTRRWPEAGRGQVYSRVKREPPEGPELRLCSEIILQGTRAEKQETNSETVAMIQVRDDAGSSGGSEKWSDLGYILEVESTRLLRGMKEKEMSRVILRCGI